MTYYNARQLCHLGNTHICLLSADWVFRHFRRCVAFISDHWCCIPHALLHVHIQSFPSEACEQLSSYRKKLCVNDFSVVCFAYISEALILSSVKAPGCGWITFYIELLLLRWFLLNRLTAYFLALLRILLHKISDFHSIGTLSRLEALRSWLISEMNQLCVEKDQSRWHCCVWDLIFRALISVICLRLWNFRQNYKPLLNFSNLHKVAVSLSRHILLVSIICTNLSTH